MGGDDPPSLRIRPFRHGDVIDAEQLVDGVRHCRIELTYVVETMRTRALAGCGSGSGVIGSRLAIAAQRRLAAISSWHRWVSKPGSTVRSFTSVSSQTSQFASVSSAAWSSDQRPAMFQVPMRMRRILTVAWL